jgi:uncharacterized membrane protein YbhN (UPF0104 family)
MIHSLVEWIDHSPPAFSGPVMNDILAARTGQAAAICNHESVAHAGAAEQMPEELSPRRVGRRLIELAIVVALVVVFVLTGPGLGDLRRDLGRAQSGWVLAAVAIEVLSTLSYVVVFRAVFCRQMTWRLSYQIGMAEQAANSVLSVSGTGGLALGAWALHKGGMTTEHIARRSVAFFFLTSLPNVGGVIVFALLFATGILHHDRDPALTYVFGGLAIAATTAVVVVLPRVRGKKPEHHPGEKRKLKVAWAWLRYSLGQGVRDGLMLLRHRPVPVLAGSIGLVGFDIVVLGVAFKALGYSPSVGVLALGYLIGQLGGNIPIPGGIGGVDGGLIGAFALYHQPLAVSTAAVLIYHAIALWVPALLGSVAFVQLRRTLQREEQAAAMCAPLAEPIEAIHLPAPAS